MTRRVLLTGGTGFVGRHTLQPLRDAGFDVHALGRRPVSGAQSHRVDLLDTDMVAAAVRAVGASHLLHLAWDVTQGRFWTAPENLDWVAASLALYRAFAEAGGQRMVVSGSCAEYDWSSAPLDEDVTALRPGTLYGVAKHALHQILASASTNSGIELAWSRVFFVYGPHEGGARLVPSVITPLLRGEPALVGEGCGRRDFMHVQDVADALVTVLASGFVGAVNVATGEARPVRDLVSLIAGQIGRPDLVRFGAWPTPPGEPASLETSALTLRRIGFKPRFTLEAGLADTIGWWRAEQVKTGRAQSIAQPGSVGG